MRSIVLSAAVWLITIQWVAAGEFKVANIFSDHMVLQRDKPVPVWGWADPGEQITIEFAGQKKQGAAAADGKWLVKLDAMAASSQAAEMRINGASGSRQKIISDILVGEVWLGSGQSNMAMTVSRSKDFEAERLAATWPQIRMFKEESAAAKTPQSDSKGSWAVCSPDSVGAYSATLYFFGREIHRELSIPVGLINSSVGGTPIESWVAAEAQRAIPELKPILDEQAKADAEFNEQAAREQHEKAVARWKEQVAEAKGAGKPLPKKPTDPLEQRKRRGGLGGLFNGKIAPLVPYALRGVVWYQGEANAQPGRGALYTHQLSKLVEDWRARWGEQLPIAWVQLPNFDRSGEDWMLVRESMLKALRIPKTGMAITIDIGEAKDIHPKNKQDVGRRLAYWALGDVYGKSGQATSGPVFASHQVDGAEVVLNFKHADAGLVAKDGMLVGFKIAGADKQWKSANARIDGERVIVSSPDCKMPVAVRYAWEANPKCNLTNGRGLPASPFRTDDWNAPVIPARQSGK